MTQHGDSEAELFPSAFWAELLDRAAAQIRRAPNASGTQRTSLVERALEAEASARVNLLESLQSEPGGSATRGAELVGDAAGLMLAISALLDGVEVSTSSHRDELIEQLTRRLGKHEEAALAGEITYALEADQAERSLSRTRETIIGVAQGSVSGDDVRLLGTQAVDVAAFLVLAAANSRESGSASAAPEPKPGGLDYALDAIRTELAARARRVEQPLDSRGDVAAHHLAAALRVRISQTTLDALATVGPTAQLDESCLNDAREAWLRLATHEYVAVTALDSQLESPTYARAFGGLKSALIEGSANVVCGARLLGRPTLFRHRRAWGHHAIALTYALEAYVAGVRGDSLSLEQAQLITLTRLVRAVAAILSLELARQPLPPTNGHSTHRGLPHRDRGEEDA
jgi:hypothetical protein